MTYTCGKDHAHGKNRTCYSKHLCRCQDCTAANRDYRRNRRTQRESLKRAAAYRKPEVSTDGALVTVTLSPRDALMVQDVLIERARLLAQRSTAAGVQRPMLETRSKTAADLAHRIRAAAEQTKGKTA